MDSKKLRIAENALRQIAEREGTSVDAVREEIRAATPAPPPGRSGRAFPARAASRRRRKSSSGWRRMRAAGQTAENFRPGHKTVRCITARFFIDGGFFCV